MSIFDTFEVKEDPKKRKKSKKLARENRGSIRSRPKTAKSVEGQRSLDDVEKGRDVEVKSAKGVAMTAEELEVQASLNALRMPSAKPDRSPRPAPAGVAEGTGKLRPAAMYDQMSIHSTDMPPQPY